MKPGNMTLLWTSLLEEFWGWDNLGTERWLFVCSPYTWSYFKCQSACGHPEWEKGTLWPDSSPGPGKLNYTLFGLIFLILHGPTLYPWILSPRMCSTQLFVLLWSVHLLYDYTLLFSLVTFFGPCTITNPPAVQSPASCERENPQDGCPQSQA